MDISLIISVSNTENNLTEITKYAHAELQQTQQGLQKATTFGPKLKFGLFVVMVMLHCRYAVRVITVLRGKYLTPFCEDHKIPEMLKKISDVECGRFQKWK